jgi:ABC-type lipoprotein export system ATPase subunit
MNVLKHINRHSHKTIVMVTHNRKYVDYAHRAIFMQDGEIASEKNYHRLLFLASLH